MVAGYSAAQVRAAEQPHLARGEPLMLLAAAALADVVRERLPRDGDGAPLVLVLAGSGDNGGDAAHAAADLAATGIRVEIVPTGSRLHAEARAAAVAAGVHVLDDADAPTVAARAAEASLIIDGILGTGTSSDPSLRGRARELVAAILPTLADDAGPVVVAADLPSGVHPDDGSVPDPTVLPATVTVTFGAAKAGLLIEPGADLSGEVHVVDLGLGPELAAFTRLVERG
ncbi:NAD(P)H-hydrate epimerase [Agromyces endophyticus]|uniref:NAD(P)H-hydrate epimerase n=1 Tax=Agromyces sp. H17E-10 TaxID=2932244 RepID=UPI001FD15503|nr:NAD(P)H-hydrate epimerase [Agromyces sp. H17E-10]UOQ89445.1 NAD(P)H-hydrate epimerase [Agromyces sp. H17E-10]